MNQNEQYLKILSIFHFVVGGMTALFACLPVFHLAMGISMLGGLFPMDPGDRFPLRIFGLMFTLIPLAIILLGWALAIAIVVSGWFLNKRQHYLYCLVIAGVECILMPYGTVLGVLTIFLLVRPEVKALFDPQPA